MEKGPSSEANSQSASPEIHPLSWDPKVHDCVHKSRHWSESWSQPRDTVQVSGTTVRVPS